MPLITYDSPVARISGRLGTAPNTFTFNNKQAVIRAQPVVNNPDTPDQQAIRAIFSSVTKRWKLITQTQRDAWTLWAKNHDVVNRLGTTVDRNGISAFVALNTAHYIDTGVILDPAPTLAQPSAPVSLELGIATQTGGDTLIYTITHTYTTLTGLYLVTRATASIPFESQTPSLSEYRYVKGVNTNSIIALPASNTAVDFTATKYMYTDQEFVGVEATIMNAQGWQSQPTRVFGQYSV